jgi:hypothetical protein
MLHRHIKSELESQSNLEDTHSDSMVCSTRTPSVIFLFIEILVETEIKSCHWDILISQDSLGHPNLAGDLTSPRWTTLLTSPGTIKKGWLLTCYFSLFSDSYVITHHVLTKVVKERERN